MPRVKLDPRYQAKRFSSMLEHKLIDNGHMTYEQLAEQIGCSRQKIWTCKTSGHWTWDDMRRIFRVLRFTDDEILKTVREDS